MTEFSAQFDALMKTAEKLDTKVDALEKLAAELKDASAFRDQIAALGTKQKELADEILTLKREGKIDLGNAEGEKTAGQLFAESAEFKDFVAGKTAKATLSVNLAAITTPVGSVQPQRLPDVKGAPELRNTIEAAFPHVPTSSNLIEFLREQQFTNAAKAVAEAGLKSESAVTFKKAEAPVRTIAHWIRITKQLAQDAEAVAAFVNTRMAYGVARAIEKQILTGDGSSENLSGIFHTGNYVPHGFTQAKEGKEFTGLDAIRRSGAVISMAGYAPNAVVLHPLDYDDILGMKDKQGRYLFGDPSKAPGAQIWGLDPLVSPDVTKGQFMVCDTLMGATVYERTATELQAFEQDGDNVTKNLITIRAEKRLAFAVEVVDCFVGGALAIPPASPEAA